MENKGYRILPLKEVVIVRAADMPKDTAAELGRKLQRLVIYVPEWDSVTSVQLDELQRIIDREKAKYGEVGT